MDNSETQIRAFTRAFGGDNRRFWVIVVWWLVFWLFGERKRPKNQKTFFAGAGGGDWLETREGRRRVGERQGGPGFRLKSNA